MELKNERELNATRAKLQLLEDRLAESKSESTDDPRGHQLSQNSLKRLINQMKEEIIRYQVHHSNEAAPKDGRCTFGMFGGDEIMQEIDRLTLEVRQEDRLQRVADEKLLEETSRAASADKFWIEDTERLIEQHRREKARKAENGDA